MHNKPEHNRGTYTPAETERLQQWTTRIYAQLAVGNRDGAVAVLDACLDELRTVQRTTTLLATPLAEICLSDTRLVNALEEYAGIVTLGDALAAEEWQFLAIPNFGEKSLKHLYAYVATFAIKRCGHLEAELARRVGMGGA